MSGEEKFNLAGKSLKEWAFIILMINLSVVIGSYAVVFWIAVTNNPGAIAITGSIDISQIVIIVFGIATKELQNNTNSMETRRPREYLLCIPTQVRRSRQAFNLQGASALH